MLSFAVTGTTAGTRLRLEYIGNIGELQGHSKNLHGALKAMLQRAPPSQPQQQQVRVAVMPDRKQVLLPMAPPKMQPSPARGAGMGPVMGHFVKPKGQAPLNFSQQHQQQLLQLQQSLKRPAVKLPTASAGKATPSKRRAVGMDLDGGVATPADAATTQEFNYEEIVAMFTSGAAAPSAAEMVLRVKYSRRPDFIAQVNSQLLG